MLEPESGPWSGACDLVRNLFSGLGTLCGIIIFVAWLVKGDRWFIDDFSHWVVRVFGATAFRLLPPLLLLALVRPLRGAVGVAFSAVSMMFAVCWWAMSFAYVLSVWGRPGALVGMFLLGVGEVPLAFVALLIHGYWRSLMEFLLAGALTLGTFALAQFLATRADARVAARRQAALGPAPDVPPANIYGRR